MISTLSSETVVSVIFSIVEVLMGNISSGISKSTEIYNRGLIFYQYCICYTVLEDICFMKMYMIRAIYQCSDRQHKIYK
jgi:hypothetical protein